MNFTAIAEPDVSLLSDTASQVLALAPISMAPLGSLLLTEISYIDSGQIKQSYYVYDVAADSYVTNLSDYVGGVEAATITAIDVAWSSENGPTFAIAYIDLTESSYMNTATGNRIAIVRGGELITNDAIEMASGQIANTGLENIVIDASGTQVGFSSAANNLLPYLDTNDLTDAFIIDLEQSVLQRVSQISEDDEGEQPAHILAINYTSETTQVLFETQAGSFSTNDLNDKNDLYLATVGLLENNINLISQQLNDEAASIVENQALLQNDRVYYVSDASNLVDSDDNLSQDIFSQHLLSGQAQRLTAGLDAQITSLSNVEYQLLGVDSGLKKLMFSSNLDNPSVTDGSLNQIYLMDLDTYQIELLSATADGTPGNDASVIGVMENFATNYAIQTEATNLVEKPGSSLVTQNKPSIKLFDTQDREVTGIELNLLKDGTLLTESVHAENGHLLITDIIDFDQLTIAEPDAYEPGINIIDAISILKHIVGLSTLTGADFEAADANNDNNINIIDAIDVLSHIVGLKTLNSYDLIDDDGDRITRLDVGTEETQSWTLVANGDVDHSGYFLQDYIVPTVDVL